MKKIYSDSEIWNKEWYLKYSLKLRMLLKYIFDNAHTSGVFEPNYIMLSFYMGESVTKDDILALQSIYQEYECKKNPNASLIEELPDGKFWVVKMAYFQCGALSQNTPAHKKIIETLLNYGLLERVVSQYKEQDKKKIGLLQGLLKSSKNPEVIEGDELPSEEDKNNSMGSATLGLPIAYPSATHRDKDRDRDMDRDSLSCEEETSLEEREEKHAPAGTPEHASAGVKPVQTCVSKAGRAEHYDSDVSNLTTAEQLNHICQEPKTASAGACGVTSCERGEQASTISPTFQFSTGLSSPAENCQEEHASAAGDEPQTNVVPLKPRKLLPESPEILAFCRDYGEVKEGRCVQLSAKERREIARVLNVEGGVYDPQYWRDVFWNAKGGWEFNKGNGNIERSKCSLGTVLEKHGEIFRKELPLKYLPKPKPKNVPESHADFQKKSENLFEPIPGNVREKVAEIRRKINNGA